MVKKIKKLTGTEKDKLLSKALEKIDKMPPESFGDVELPEDEFKTVKMRITTYIDDDIYYELRRRADEQGTKYQTLLNNYLRVAMNDAVSQQMQEKISEAREIMNELQELQEFKVKGKRRA